jgi:SAM-dependent methyltransferase
VITGELVSGSCSKGFAIRRGVPRLLPPTLSAVEEKTAAAFGWHWQEFVEMHDQYETQFLDCIHFIKAEFFRDKVVMDAGCGIGRHAYCAARYGTREVIAMDLSDAVDTAYANTASMPTMHVVQADIYCPRFRRSASGGAFDFIYAIGVVHHLPDPEAGFKSLLWYLIPSGSIFVSVYDRENNGIVYPERSRAGDGHRTFRLWPGPSRWRCRQFSRGFIDLCAGPGSSMRCRCTTTCPAFRLSNFGATTTSCSTT